MVLVDGTPVCTACGAHGQAEEAAHPVHHHDHEHAAGAHAGRPDDLTRLRILLPHWLEHNEEHLRDLRAWALKAQELDQPQAAASIESAVQRMEAANRDLAAALDALGR
jgi:hypothetical protein